MDEEEVLFVQLTKGCRAVLPGREPLERRHLGGGERSEDSAFVPLRSSWQ